MRLLYTFGAMPVAGYLDPDETSSKNARRFELGIAICQNDGLVQQAYSDSKESLIKLVYTNFQPTYTTSGLVSNYIESFLAKAIKSSGAKLGDYVMEVGSNDGLLLQLLKKRGMNPIGFEPSSDLSSRTRSLGIEVIEDFFGAESARNFIEHRPPVKLLISRHTLEHAFDPLDFLHGIEIVLEPEGLAVIEIPYLRLQMMNGHFEAMTFQHTTFFTINSIDKALRCAGLQPVDVTFVDMDGGSMVIFLRKVNIRQKSRVDEIENILAFERTWQLDRGSGYKAFFQNVNLICKRARNHLTELSDKGCKIVGYGAGSKGQSLLNMLRLDTKQVPFVIDDTPGNAGKYIPGTGILVISSRDARASHSDVIFITAPTHIQEILQKEIYRRKDGTKFLATVPDYHYNAVPTLL